MSRIHKREGDQITLFHVLAVPCDVDVASAVALRECQVHFVPQTPIVFGAYAYEYASDHLTAWIAATVPSSPCNNT